VAIHPVVVLHKINAVLLATLKPLGIWGLGGLALIDSGLFPIPVSMDGVLIGYVANDHKKFLLYCLMASAASVLGSLVPYYVGRAGGELFLLKRINRERYERMRDKFERQEFLAIMIPAMLPPPTPLKLFEFSAGVFEMKPAPFLLAIFCGKFLQFLACSLLTIWFGPTLMHSLRHLAHEHHSLIIGIAVAGIFWLLFYAVRKIFDSRKGVTLPSEENL
jgi:membrane protein YqaA with SNARE-associated domain